MARVVFRALEVRLGSVSVSHRERLERLDQLTPCYLVDQALLTRKNICPGEKLEVASFRQLKGLS